MYLCLQSSFCLINFESQFCFSDIGRRETDSLYSSAADESVRSKDSPSPYGQWYHSALVVLFCTLLRNGATLDLPIWYSVVRWLSQPVISLFHVPEFRLYSEYLSACSDSWYQCPMDTEVVPEARLYLLDIQPSYCEMSVTISDCRVVHTNKY